MAEAMTVTGYDERLLQHDILSREEEVKLFQAFKQGSEEAKNRIILLNQRMVREIALKYYRKISPKKARFLSLADLMQHGNIGLMTAMDKFDLLRGFRFYSHAIWWVRQSIQRAIQDTSRTIRMPVNIGEDIRKLNKAVDRLVKQGISNEQEQDEAAAQMLDWSHDKLMHTLATKAAVQDCRLENFFGEENDHLNSSDWNDVVADSKTPSPDQIVYSGEIQSVLKKLDWRESFIIQCRFGFGKEGSLSLEETGNRLGITKERVRQLEKSALQNLRQVIKPDEILDFDDDSIESDDPFEVLLAIQSGRQNEFRKNYFCDHRYGNARLDYILNRLNSNGSNHSRILIERIRQEITNRKKHAIRNYRLDSSSGQLRTILYCANQIETMKISPQFFLRNITDLLDKPQFSWLQKKNHRQEIARFFLTNENHTKQLKKMLPQFDQNDPYYYQMATNSYSRHNKSDWQIYSRAIIRSRLQMHKNAGRFLAMTAIEKYDYSLAWVIQSRRYYLSSQEAFTDAGYDFTEEQKLHRQWKQSENRRTRLYLIRWMFKNGMELYRPYLRNISPTWASFVHNTEYIVGPWALAFKLATGIDYYDIYGKNGKWPSAKIDYFVWRDYQDELSMTRSSATRRNSSLVHALIIRYGHWGLGVEYIIGIPAELLRICMPRNLERLELVLRYIHNKKLFIPTYRTMKNNGLISLYDFAREQFGSLQNALDHYGLS
ncbi:RNA polymerase sigma factor RpoD/SigA [Patescibacteria group bacterium]